MPVQTIQDPPQVFEIVDSGKPAIIHYWSPNEGPESPLQELLENESERFEGRVGFYIVDSGFLHPELEGQAELPLTALYNNRQTVNTAPFDQHETFQLIQQAERFI